MTSLFVPDASCVGQRARPGDDVARIRLNLVARRNTVSRYRYLAAVAVLAAHAVALNARAQSNWFVHHAEHGPGQHSAMLLEPSTPGTALLQPVANRPSRAFNAAASQTTKRVTPAFNQAARGGGKSGSKSGKASGGAPPPGGAPAPRPRPAPAPG